ncbi:ABC transporter substrate-binding protein [Leifsonia sp. LS-T14]|uniref:ABC transporter substrate-binding protein n=1 Tax=unclassified Leifsonia TaxID=2663824 RepID=UPI0035A671AA
MAAVLLAGCSTSSAGTAGNRIDPSGPPPKANLLVWTDATRQAGFEAYEKKYKDSGTKLKLTTLPDKFANKILLATKAKSGWPDVLFDGGTNNVSLFTSKLYDYAADLTPLLPAGTADKFFSGAIGPCEINGKLYCLRNDYAPNMLWYNTKLFQQFGYKVPTTYEEYQSLGVKLAAEHPGYSLGAIGGDQENFYFDGANCNYGEVAGQTFSIDLKSANCSRAIKLLDTLLTNKTVSPASEFAPDFVKDYGSTDKVLAMVGPIWYGQYLFAGTYKTPAGEMAVSAPLKWAKDSKTYNGTYGGGVYYVSKHSANPTAAASLAYWMATSKDFQTTGPTFPAYQPDAAAWLSRAQSSGVVSSPNLSSVVNGAAKAVDAKQQAAVNIPSTIDRGWSSQVVPTIANGRTIASVVDKWQTFMENSAKAAGFQVK